MGSEEPSGGIPQLLNPPLGRCPSRSIGSGGPMASPRWRFYGFGSGLESNERRSRRPCSLLSGVRQGHWGLSWLSLPGSVQREAASSPSRADLRTSISCCSYRMRRLPLRDATRSVEMQQLHMQRLDVWDECTIQWKRKRGSVMLPWWHE